LAIEAGVPAGVINIVTGPGEVGRTIVKHPGIDKIAFTGSTVVGQEIMRSAADTVKRITLELGESRRTLCSPMPTSTTP